MRIRKRRHDKKQWMQKGGIGEIIAVIFALSMAYYTDRKPNFRAEASRRKVFDMLVAEKMLVHGIHYPFPALAHVEKTPTGYREIPVAWNPTI
jgi:hypothetical protein